MENVRPESLKAERAERIQNQFITPFADREIILTRENHLRNWFIDVTNQDGAAERALGLKVYEFMTSPEIPTESDLTAVENMIQSKICDFAFHLKSVGKCSPNVKYHDYYLRIKFNASRILKYADILQHRMLDKFGESNGASKPGVYKILILLRQLFRVYLSYSGTNTVLTLNFFMKILLRGATSELVAGPDYLEMNHAELLSQGDPIVRNEVVFFFELLAQLIVKSMFHATSPARQKLLMKFLSWFQEFGLRFPWLSVPDYLQFTEKHVATAKAMLDNPEVTLQKQCDICWLPTTSFKCSQCTCFLCERCIAKLILETDAQQCPFCEKSVLLYIPGPVLGLD